MADELPILEFQEPEQWAEWLEAHPGETNGVWLKFAKKGTAVQTINYDQALEVALCYGWIDAISHKLDDVYYLQKFTPRRNKSVWSARNTKLVQQLIRDGKMQPAGQAQIDAAKADGRWDKAYAGQKAFAMPADFVAAVAQLSPEAQKFYENLSRSIKFAFYYRLQDAKKAETRERRMQQILDMLERGEKLY